MNRKKTITLITVFSIAMAAMFILQAIWLDSVFTLKKAAFRRELSNVFEYIYDDFHRYASTGEYEKGDARVRALYLEVDSLRMLMRNSSFQNYSYSDRYEIIDKGDYKDFWRWMVASDSLHVLFHKAYFESIGEESLQTEFAYYQKYAPYLDTLIRERLQRNKMMYAFKYAIYDPGTQSFIYQNEDFTDRIIDESFKCAINPGDAFFPPKYLFIYFTNERLALLEEMRWVLFTCVVLIIIMTSVVAYAIWIILQQRESIIKKRDFGRNMTHEFRVPITTIKLSCDILSDPEIQNSKELIQKYVHIISVESQRLQNMVEKVLHAVKMNKSDLELEKKKVSIRHIIKDSIASLEFQIDEKKAVINTLFDEKEDEIMADPAFLTNAMINIIENALKYSREDCTINIIVSGEKEFMKIIVEDNGIGISKIQQKMIFEKLYRAPSAEVQSVTGFGLGLNYVANVIEQHKGNIKVESELKTGTRFIIYLPK